jgi:hypothetical protein
VPLIGDPCSYRGLRSVLIGGPKSSLGHGEFGSWRLAVRAASDTSTFSALATYISLPQARCTITSGIQARGISNVVLGRSKSCLRARIERLRSAFFTTVGNIHQLFDLPRRYFKIFVHLSDCDCCCLKDNSARYIGPQ